MGMSTSDALSAIARRLEELTAEEAAAKRIYDARLQEIGAERSELQVAAKVLDRLNVGSAPALPFPSPPGQAPPRNIPEMIVSVIRERHAQGLPPLTNKGVLEALTKRWGEDDPNHIRPALWRMTQAGRLIKDGDTYTLPAEQL